MESNLLRHPARLFIEAMAESVKHFLHENLACSRKRDAQDYIPRNAQRTRFAGVLNRRFGYDFKIR